MLRKNYGYFLKYNESSRFSIGEIDIRRTFRGDRKSSSIGIMTGLGEILLF